MQGRMWGASAWQQPSLLLSSYPGLISHVSPSFRAKGFKLLLKKSLWSCSEAMSFSWPMPAAD